MEEFSIVGKLILNFSIERSFEQVQGEVQGHHALDRPPSIDRDPSSFTPLAPSNVYRVSPFFSIPLPLIFPSNDRSTRGDLTFP